MTAYNNEEVPFAMFEIAAMVSARWESLRQGIEGEMRQQFDKAMEKEIPIAKERFAAAANLAWTKKTECIHDWKPYSTHGQHDEMKAYCKKCHTSLFLGLCDRCKNDDGVCSVYGMICKNLSLR